MKEVVIKLPDGIYNEIQRHRNVNSVFLKEVTIAINNGIVLPEHHDDLISRSDALARMQEYHDDCSQTSEYTRLGFETAMEVVKDAETIIPATKIDRR